MQQVRSLYKHMGNDFDFLSYQDMWTYNFNTKKI